MVLERATGVWRGDGSDFESGSDESLFGQGPLDKVGLTSPTAFSLICSNINESLTGLPYCNPEVRIMQNINYLYVTAYIPADAAA